jgi:RHS repeat-associated protein
VGCRKLNSHTKYRRARFISVTQKASGKITRTTRQGAYFTAPVTVSNTSNSVTEELDITAVKFDAAQDKDIVNTITSKYTVAKTPQTFTYDDDGNLLSDGKFTYTWNAENRLIEIHNSSFLIRNSYDYMGRRTSKKVYTHNGTDWVLSKHEQFAYNGYKQIASFVIHNSSFVIEHSYTWQPTGQDVPLWIKDGTNYYYYIVDGNKNIRSMVDTTGNEVASYDYNPFGKVTGRGTYASTNLFRFSSEYHDDETELVYYNFRYYSLKLGRWIKRDPIEEFEKNKKGKIEKLNLLYGFVYNNAVNKWDSLGNKENAASTVDGAAGIVVDLQQGTQFFKYYMKALENCRKQQKENYLKAKKEAKGKSIKRNYCGCCIISISSFEDGPHTHVSDWVGVLVNIPCNKAKKEQMILQNNFVRKTPEGITGKRVGDYVDMAYEAK